MPYLTIKRQVEINDATPCVRQGLLLDLTPQVLIIKGLNLLTSNIYIYIFIRVLSTRGPPLYRITPVFVDEIKSKFFYRRLSTKGITWG